MSDLKIQHYSSAEILSEAANFVRTRIAEILEKNDSPVFLVSGGSSVTLYLEIWRKLGNSKPFTVGLIDERWLPVSADGNNEKQLREAGLIDLFQAKGGSFFGMVPTTFPPVTSPQKYATELGKKYEKLLTGASYSLLLLGMGPDGHTAGLLPTQNPALARQLFENPKFVTYYQIDTEVSDNPFPERISITARAIATASESIVFAKGAEKAPALEKFLAETGEKNLTPVRLLREIEKPVTVVTDI